MTQEPATEISRPVVEVEIERLIDLLDTLDADPDIEDTGDAEPSLGAPERQAGSWRGLYQLGNDDREADSADEEPSLGASEPRWYGISSFKAEALVRQRPDLFEGSQTERTRQTSQFGWSSGSGDDREWECDDEGAIDCDLESEGSGFSNYLGACTVVSTLPAAEPGGQI